MKKTRILVLLLTLLLTLSCLTLPLLAAAEPAAEDPSATASADASADASGDAQDTAEQESSQEVIVSADPSFTVAAKAALLIDLNTGRTVYEQDADERVYPASLTKIMTCLLALENGNLSDVITVDESALSGLNQDSSVVGLKVGEQITLENLLYCMMVSSGNDAANVVAEYIAGSVADFVRMMNERAYALGCKDTHFNNPHGLHDESHYTTARDLAIITQAALKSENFRQIVDTAEYVIPASATGEEHKLKTTNMLIYKSTGNSLYYSRATGVKTGYTSAAGRCLIATAEDDGIRFLSVLCGAKTSILDTGDLLMESFPETIKLLDYGFDGAVCSAGGYVFCGDKVLVDLPMEPQLAQGVRSAMERHGVECTLEARDATYGSLKMIERWSFTHRDAGPLNSEAARWRKAMEDGMTMSPLAEYKGEPLYKIVYIAERSEDLNEAKRLYEDRFVFCESKPDGLNGGYVNGELINRKFDKGRGIKAVCDYLGVPLQNSIGFGDSDNDLQMTDVVGISVCMADGSASLKQRCDRIAPSVYEDGIAKEFAALGLI